MRDANDLYAVMLSIRPVHLWAIEVPSALRLRPSDGDVLTKALELGDLLEYRAVDLGRLPTIMATGVDVVPTDAPIFVSYLDKAFEYGGWPKLVMAFDPSCMKRTFRELPADAPDAQHEAAMRTYPTVIPSDDGSRRWYTRLADGDPRAAKSYETMYARWIPGNAMEALQGVLIFHRPGEGDLVRRAVSQAVDASQ